MVFLTEIVTMRLKAKFEPSTQRFRAALRLGFVGLVALHLPVLIALVLLTWSASAAVSTTDLTVKIEPLDEQTGDVLLYVFSQREAARFPVDLEAAVCHHSAAAEEASIDFVCVDLPEGEYAAIAVHDLNGNGVLDHSWIGLPAEPLGFSSGCRPRFGPPSFRRCRFQLTAEQRAIAIRLR